MTLKADIQKIKDGWSAKTCVVERARLMRSHSEGGNQKRAEEIACEIEALQRAERERNGFQPHVCREGCEEWRISHTFWASRLIRAHKVSRSFFPDFGCTEQEALSEACRAYFAVQHRISITAQDIAPLFPATRRAAA